MSSSSNRISGFLTSDCTNFASMAFRNPCRRTKPWELSIERSRLLRGARDEPYEQSSAQEGASPIASGVAGFRFVATRWGGKAKFSQDKRRWAVDRIPTALENDVQYGNAAPRTVWIGVREETL